jgi:hypothetical protein
VLVIDRSMGTLVVEEGKSSSLIVGGSSAGIGAVLIAIGVVRGEYLMIAVGAVLLFYGVKALLFSRAHMHRFDRLRRKVVIEARGLLKTERREIAFADIADIVVEKAGRRNPPSLYIHYVMRGGERIPWAESYDGAKEETLECARAAREMLELPPLIMDPG